jgi:hypothetical protein
MWELAFVESQDTQVKSQGWRSRNAGRSCILPLRVMAEVLGKLTMTGVK